MNNVLGGLRSPGRLAGFLILVLFLSPPVQAQSPVPDAAGSDNGIVFLHLRFKTDGSLELLDAEARPGRLKPEGAHGATLNCRLVSSSGDPLFTVELEDPSRRRVEWEDPAQPGRLRGKLIEVPQAEFVVRIPRLEKTRRIEFRRPTTTPAEGHPEARAATDSGPLLGTFNLNL